MPDDTNELTPDDANELSQALSERLAVRDQGGHVVLQVAQIATVYVEEPYRREVREAITACCEGYAQRWGAHLRWALHPEGQRMDRFGTGEGSYPRSWLPALPEDDSFFLLWHSAEYDGGAGEFSLEASGMERRPYVQVGYLRLSFPLLWFAEGPGSLVAVLLDTCSTLKPVSGYGGISVIESAESYTGSVYEPMVYSFAQRFPGLEADYPGTHALWLPDGREGKRDGIKGGNWLTALSDRYVSELGGADKVEADLKALDSRFVVHRYDGGVVLQAGPRPQLGDAERNLWPSLYVKLAKYLKPVRVTQHNPFQHGGPGVRFDKERSEAWLRRFDDR
jgi:hypothetical protein